ncbi:Crp/Fnr family transcriptional regulator [Sphingomonas sp.]|uniref:Crp/Fnr family transcriptional regulator n=1 Tax=Sphingomonas sp. TaxID=28214 RepID=UPI002DD6209E|nr:Crp/Fnr family transcriptional regulator [Sphingomonas sp.]
MRASCFAEVLGERIDLTSNEKAALARLEEKSRDIRRGAVLQRENEPSGDLHIVRRGLLMSYVLLDDGSRQILRFYFPGDMLGVPAMIYRESPETIAALVDSEVCPFDRAALSRLFEEHPRVATMILVLSQVERVALTDRLAALGRTSAKARVAALILDMRNRMAAQDKSITDTFSLGLTQEEIGDATGLTAVHVNRMLRQLEEDGLIAREGGRMTIRDQRALARAANYVDRYAGLELGWLPAAR